MNAMIENMFVPGCGSLVKKKNGECLGHIKFFVPNCLSHYINDD